MKLVKDVGYMIIYASDIRMYKLFAQNTILKKTVTTHGVEKETLYERVEGHAEIDCVESISEKWKQYGVGSRYEYIVLEQLTADGKSTGYIKVVSQAKAKVKGRLDIQVYARREDCVYFKRRTAK